MLGMVLIAMNYFLHLRHAFDLFIKELINYFANDCLENMNWPVIVGLHDLVVGVSASYQYGSFVMAGRGADGIIGLSPGCGKGLIGG